jgi:hypothetical protein
MRLLAAPVLAAALCAATPACAQTVQLFSLVDTLVALYGDFNGVPVREVERRLCRELLLVSPEKVRPCAEESARRNDAFDKAVKSVESARKEGSLDERRRLLESAASSLLFVKNDLYRWTRLYFRETAERLGGRGT